MVTLVSLWVCCLLFIVGWFGIYVVICLGHCRLVLNAVVVLLICRSVALLDLFGLGGFVVLFALLFVVLLWWAELWLLVALL